jgi:hypothetical protein
LVPLVIETGATADVSGAMAAGIALWAPKSCPEMRRLGVVVPVWMEQIEKRSSGASGAQACQACTTSTIWLQS